MPDSDGRRGKCCSVCIYLSLHLVLNSGSGLLLFWHVFKNNPLGCFVRQVGIRKT